jgi:hypothetical protein
MVGTLQTQKKLFELKENPEKADILVINLDTSGFETALLSKDLTIIKTGELIFKEVPKNSEDLENYFAQLVSEFHLAQPTFTSIYINWPGKNFTLVPSAYYKPEKAKELLEFSVGKTEEGTICVNDVKPDIKLVFSVPTSLKNILDKTFPHHQLQHSGACLINLFFTHFQLKKANVLLSIREKQIELVIKKDKQLLLYNIFDIKTNEDILYYLLFSIEQFKLDPVTLQLAISANRETNDELFDAVKKYIRHVNFAVTDKVIQRKEVFETLPHHFYFSLLNRPVCE